MPTAFICTMVVTGGHDVKKLPFLLIRLRSGSYEAGYLRLVGCRRPSSEIGPFHSATRIGATERPGHRALRTKGAGWCRRGSAGARASRDYGVPVGRRLSDPGAGRPTTRDPRAVPSA